jgi:peptide/nickel transport system permease protein
MATDLQAAAAPTGLPPTPRGRRTPRLGLSKTEIGRRRELRIGIGIVVLVVLMSILVPIVSRYSTEGFVATPLQAPSWSHLFGTDEFGRDLFTRTFAAGRLNLGVAAAGVIVPLAVGTLIGVLVGSSRRRGVDALVMRIVDGIIAIPFVVLVLALVVVVGTQRTFLFLPAGIPALLVAIVATSWAIYARLARGQTLAFRNREYILATRLLGYSRWRIVSRHLLPPVFSTTATYAASEAILIVSVTASLAFLGAGVQPPTPEWGSLIFEGRNLLPTAWWLSVLPGLVLAITGFGFALIADAIVDRTSR